MKITRIVIKGGSGYCNVDEAYEDKVTLTDCSISYEYRPDEMAESATNGFRKWKYTTTSPIFKLVFQEIANRTPYYLYYDNELFATDIGPTEIIVTFEDKHREKACFFCPSEFFREYFNLIKKLVPKTEDTPAVLLTADEFEDEK